MFRYASSVEEYRELFTLINFILTFYPARSSKGLRHITVHAIMPLVPKAEIIFRNLMHVCHNLMVSSSLFGRYG